MNTEKLLEAYGLDELKFLKLLEHVTIAELEDDFSLCDPYLFNEQRLYESLGKEDALRVIGQVVEALLGEEYDMRIIGDTITELVERERERGK